MKIFFSSLIALSFLLIMGCNGNTGNQNTSDTTVSITETMPSSNEVLTIITENEGRYPRDIRIFESPTFSTRLRNIAGAQYDSIIKNFNVETPVVSEAGIYKFTGCKQNSCPEFHTTILYDSANNNLNVLIQENETTNEFTEKGKINYTESLKSK